MRVCSNTSSNNDIGCWYKKVNGKSGGSSPSTPSLDNYCQNCTTRSNWSKKQKRAYQRLNSGFGKHRGERARFITLTTSKRGMEGGKRLNDSFRVLKERIRRKTPRKLFDEGYITKDGMERYYRDKDVDEGLKFEYFKVETMEGNGVMHIIYFGDYIPQKWLSENWGDIHLSPIVDIRACRQEVGNADRLARYTIKQYVAGNDEFKRFSWSWGWVFKGFVGVFKGILKFFGYQAGLGVWKDLMIGKRMFRLKSGLYRIGLDPPPAVVEKVQVKRGFRGGIKVKKKWNLVEKKEPVLYRFCG